MMVKSRIGRVMLIPALILAGAWSWLSYIVRGAPDAKRKAMLSDLWGYDGPEMSQHWARLGNPKDPEYLSAFHSLKNCGTEYARLEAERAYKAGSLALIVAFIVGAVLGWALA